VELSLPRIILILVEWLPCQAQGTET
jgi:hypothetical protein